MEDEDLRFFLAHDIRVPAEQLNEWRDALTTLWDGTPCFHGIIRPSTFPKEAYCGRATFDLMAGFLRERKPTWLWNQNDSSFHIVSACERVPGDDYTMWGRLVPEEQR